MTTGVCVGVRAASGERRSKANDDSTTGTDEHGEEHRADAERAAEHDADGERAHLEHTADEPDAPPGASRADEHQRVARPGAEIGADVERRSPAR